MNKVKKSVYVASMVLMASCHQPATAPAIPSDAGVEEKVEQVLARMTLEEKIGQMTQLSIDVLGKFENDDFVLDDAKLQEAIGQYKVGSILNSPGPVAQNCAKWQEIIGKIVSIRLVQS